MVVAAADPEPRGLTMSVINKVLRDLDERQAASVGEKLPPSSVRSVPAPRAGHEWFWRTLAFLVLVALGWVAWVFHQIQPRPIATELAEQAADQAAKRAALKAAPAVVTPPAPVVTSPAPVATPPAPVGVPPAPPVAAKSAPQQEPLRFAYSIDTPIEGSAPKAGTQPAAEQAKPAAAASPRSEQTPKAGVKKPAEKPRFERRDAALTPAETAETEFRRGVDLLKRGRATEAEAAFRVALVADASHRGARQAMVALRIERGDLEGASRLLNETLSIDPNQPEFAVAMARIHVERGNLLGAIAVLDAAAPSAEGYGELHVLRGTVLQRLGRHPQAADAYRAALRAQAGTPQAWLGLGISLEAQEKRPEAAQAFRNALAAGPVSAEVRTFAEQRIQALR